MSVKRIINWVKYKFFRCEYQYLDAESKSHHILRDIGMD